MVVSAYIRNSIHVIILGVTAHTYGLDLVSRLHRHVAAVLGPEGLVSRRFRFTSDLAEGGDHHQPALDAPFRAIDTGGLRRATFIGQLRRG